MNPLILAADVVAILTLTFLIYYPRHRRRDMITAFIGVNVGVLAVAATLATVEVGVGVGLGLFGVLSIIRLRSLELDQAAVAYYFAALSLGLLGGLGVTNAAMSVALMVGIVGALALADSPRLFARSRTQLVNLDRAYTDESALTAHLERMLGARVRRLDVRRLDLVSDTTLVQVHYDLPAAGRPRLDQPEPVLAQREVA